jgi:hypothetical protein
MLRRVERIATPSTARRRRLRLLDLRLLNVRLLLNLRLRRRRTRWGSATALHSANLRFELLVAILQLLDRAGELANLVLEPVDPQRQLAAALPAPAVSLLGLLLILRLLLILWLLILWLLPLPLLLRRLLRRGLRRQAVAVAKEIVEEALRMSCARRHRHESGDRRNGAQPKRAAKHWTRSTVILQAASIRFPASKL